MYKLAVLQCFKPRAIAVSIVLCSVDTCPSVVETYLGVSVAHLLILRGNNYFQRGPNISEIYGPGDQIFPTHIHSGGTRVGETDYVVAHHHTYATILTYSSNGTPSVTSCVLQCSW